MLMYLLMKVVFIPSLFYRVNNNNYLILRKLFDIVSDEITMSHQ